MVNMVNSCYNYTETQLFDTSLVLVSDTTVKMEVSFSLAVCYLSFR